MPGFKLFLTKTWGFDPKRYPTFGFVNQGGRDNFLRQAAHGDWIAIAGTRQDPTAPEDRGRLLGMCQVGHEKVDADTVMRAIGTQLSPAELDSEGRYRWRWAMPIIHAVLFDEKPDLKSVLGSYLAGQEWAAYARDVGAVLGAEAVAKLLALRTTTCPVVQVPILDKERAYAEAMALHRKYGSSGPPPSLVRGGSERELGVGYAYAHALKGGRVAAFKIGSTHDPQARLLTLNRELRTELTGCEWVPVHQQIFPTEQMAFQFEQMLLARFRDRLVQGEREIVVVPKAELDETWLNLFASKAWAIKSAIEVEPI